MPKAALPTTPARPGRKAAPVWTVEDAAGLLDVEPDLLRRGLELGKVGIFPGAFKDPADAWWIPERDVRALLAGRAPERLLSLQSVAAMLDASYHHVFRRFKELGLVESIPLLGIQRVWERDVLRICGRKA